MATFQLRMLLAALHVAAVLRLEGVTARSQMHSPSHAFQVLDHSAPQELDTGSHLRSLKLLNLLKGLKSVGDDEVPSGEDYDLDLDIPVADEDADHSFPDFPEPVVIEAEGEARGTVIMLHGLTNSGEIMLESTGALREAVTDMKWIYPTAPTWLGVTSWYRLVATTFAEDAEDLEQSLSYVQSLIDAEVEAGTPADKIFVAGYSQGGSVALAGLRSFDSLAGIVGMATFLPRPNEDPIVAESMQNVPVLMTHGALDFTVPLLLSRWGYQRLLDEGANIEYEIYATMEHEMREDMLEDVGDLINSIL